jgi:RimJ/RimL family protein N-acetyltransferase
LRTAHLRLMLSTAAWNTITHTVTPCSVTRPGAVSTNSVIFETERLVVRPYTRDDVEFVFDMYSRWEVQRFIGATPRSLESTEEALAAIDRWRALSQSDALSGAWAVTLRGSDQLIGTVMLKLLPLSAPSHPLPLSDDYEIGWHLHPDHWGNGYATEAGAGVMRHAFDGGLPEVLAVVYPDNEPSKQVARRLGMEYAGRTARYYNLEVDLFRATAPIRPRVRQAESQHSL